MATKTPLKKSIVPTKKSTPKDSENPFMLPPKMVGALADEVARTLVRSLPGILSRPHMPRSKNTKKKSKKQIEQGIFLDTSAIIDGRIFDLLHTGLLNGTIIIPESILLELKHLADSQDMVKRERGKKGLDYLEKLKKSRVIKVTVLSEENEKGIVTDRRMEVDEKLIRLAKNHKGKIITCDANLEKKATIENVPAINVNVLANALKIIAVPGESLHIKLLHPGKDLDQGVGYMDDGTMVVVEEGINFVGKNIDVVVSRVIQTSTGRILFAKKI